MVALIAAASSAIPLNDEILPEDNQFISVDNSAGDQTTTASQSAQQVAGNEAETDEPMSQGEVPLDDEDLDHGTIEAVVKENPQEAIPAIPDELIDTGLNQGHMYGDKDHIHMMYKRTHVRELLEREVRELKARLKQCTLEAEHFEAKHEDS